MEPPRAWFNGSGAAYRVPLAPFVDAVEQEHRARTHGPLTGLLLHGTWTPRSCTAHKAADDPRPGPRQRCNARPAPSRARYVLHPRSLWP
jgi:hypothetical protein